MKRLVFIALAALVASTAAAAPKKYHFELTAVTPKPDVKPDAGKIAQDRVKAQLDKAFASNPQLVSDMTGAPDPANAQAYRGYLAKHGITGSYLVTVEITSASEELQPMEDKPDTQRMVVHVGLHVLGETIPSRTMAFTGDGAATVKQEIGMKVRDADRNYAWDGAAETAVDDALKTCFAKLAQSKIK